MTAPARDPLDQAIDRVAARLVSVEHDEAMAERIVARLPERSGLGGWLRVLGPQAAVATVLIVATLVWTTRDNEQVVRHPVAAPRVAEAGTTASDVPAVSAPVPLVNAPVNAVRIATRQPAASEPLPDHERSLAPVEAPIALEVAALASPSLPEEAPVVLAPIVLAELPLSGEPNSPR